MYDCEKKTDESGIFEPVDHIDRRYWLLTVVAGLFTEKDFPVLEEKLAKLYRIAFLRQQARHLGLSNNNSTMNHTLHDVVERRKRFADRSILIEPTRTYNETGRIRTTRFAINRNVYERQVLKMKRQRNQVKREALQTPQPATFKNSYDIDFKPDERNKRNQLRNQNFMQKVKVTIHNLLQEDKNILDSNKIDVPKDKNNQTEIVYSVIVDGRPVLASTAAEDMRLVKIDEVVKIMENEIFLKAERK